MIKTHGLTHINLAVRDPDRSLRFYEQVFGVREYYRDQNSIQVQGPGSQDVIAFEKDSANAEKSAASAILAFVSLILATSMRRLGKLSVRAAKLLGAVSSDRVFLLLTCTILMAMRLRSGTSEIASAPKGVHHREPGSCTEEFCSGSGPFHRLQNLILETRLRKHVISVRVLSIQAVPACRVPTVTPLQ